MKTPIMFDERNCHQIKQVEKNKVEYHSVGRKAVLNLEQDTKTRVAATVR